MKNTHKAIEKYIYRLFFLTTMTDNIQYLSFDHVKDSILRSLTSEDEYDLHNIQRSIYQTMGLMMFSATSASVDAPAVTFDTIYPDIVRDVIQYIMPNPPYLQLNPASILAECNCIDDLEDYNEDDDDDVCVNVVPGCRDLLRVYESYSGGEELYYVNETRLFRELCPIGSKIYTRIRQQFESCLMCAFYNLEHHTLDTDLPEDFRYNGPSHNPLNIQGLMQYLVTKTILKKILRGSGLEPEDMLSVTNWDQICLLDPYERLLKLFAKVRQLFIDQVNSSLGSSTESDDDDN
jgi:hypothetical protein